MNFQINKISESLFALMSEQGHVLAHFTSLIDALSFCEQWYTANSNERRDSMSIAHKAA